MSDEMNSFKYGIVPYMSVGQHAASVVGNSGLPIVASAFHTLGSELMNDKVDAVTMELMSILDGTHKLIGVYKAISRKFSDNPVVIVERMSPELMRHVFQDGNGGYLSREFNLHSMLEYKKFCGTGGDWSIIHSPDEESKIPELAISYSTDRPTVFISTSREEMSVVYDLSKCTTTVYPTWTTDRVPVGLSATILKSIDKLIYDSIMGDLVTVYTSSKPAAVRNKISHRIERLAEELGELDSHVTEALSISAFEVTLFFTLPNGYYVEFEVYLSAHGNTSIRGSVATLASNHLLMSDIYDFLFSTDFDLSDVSIKRKGESQ